MRVCLDTNVLVAAFATRGLCADVFRAVLAEHDLVIGEVVLGELRRVLRTKLRLPAERIDPIEALPAGFPVIPRPAHRSDIAIRSAASQGVPSTDSRAGADRP